MKLKICYLLLFFIFTSKTFSQIGIATTDPKAQLDIRSSNQLTPANTDGILIPKVDAFPVINPTVNQDGMLIYLRVAASFSSVVRQPGFYYWQNATSNWIGFQNNTTTDWSLTGNSGTNPSINFLGTTDDINIVFKRNSRRAAFIGDGTFNLATFNYNNGNTSFGDNSLLNPTVNFGAQTGVRNSAFGTNALPKLTSGRRNVAIGDSSLYENTTGNENTAVGVGAMFSNVISSGNTAIGRNALTTFTGSSTSNIGNTAIGFASLRKTTTGIRNSSIGYNSMLENLTGENNVALGFEALKNSVGNGNVGIGYQSGFSETGNNKLYIENSNANANAALIYGEFDNNIVRINGTLQISNPSSAPGYALPNDRGTANQVLRTDGAGATIWANVSTLETDPEVSSTVTNSVPKWNGTTLVDGIINDNGTNVGIGTIPSVGNKLDVAGNTKTTNFQMTSGANSNYILQSDASGNASWIQNPINTLSVVRVNLSTPQVLATSGWQKVNFDSELFDTDNEFDSTTNRFVATKAGYYRVNASIHTNDQSNNQLYSVGIRVNGGFYQQTTANHFGNGPVDRNVNCIVNLSINDYVEVFVENWQTGVNVDNFIGKTVFEIEQIK